MGKLKTYFIIAIFSPVFALANPCKDTFNKSKTANSKQKESLEKTMKKALQNLNSLKSHLKTHSVNDTAPKTGNSLLHLAVASPKVSYRKIELLITQGASPYIKNKNGERVIESPVFKDYIAKVLKEYKPDPSKKTYYVYLAGPEVFLPFNLTAGEFTKALTFLFNKYHLQNSNYNIEGLFPFDSGYVPKNLDFQDGLNIYKGDIDLMNRSQAIMANMVKFRGPGMDGGTAFEMGYMTAQGKVIVSYYDEKPYFDNPRSNRSYREKVIEEMGEITVTGEGKTGLKIHQDKNGLSVEPFEMPDNLMMVGPNVSKNGKANIPESPWLALFLIKKKLNKIN